MRPSYWTLMGIFDIPNQPIRADRVPTTKTQSREETIMEAEGIVITLIVGLVAGWLAGRIVEGTGYGIIGDLVVGVIGALIGGWLLPQLGIYLGPGIVSAVISALIGAIVLLVVIRLVRGGGRWRA
jgi:uncharacterized membrane protein YeaQ/YmgE (transglycosylase-associated protein family)